MEKETFEPATIEIVKLSVLDVINTSGGVREDNDENASEWDTARYW